MTNYIELLESKDPAFESSIEKSLYSLNDIGWSGWQSVENIESSDFGALVQKSSLLEDGKLMGLEIDNIIKVVVNDLDISRENYKSDSAFEAAFSNQGIDSVLSVNAVDIQGVQYTGAMIDGVFDWFCEPSSPFESAVCSFLS